MDDFSKAQRRVLSEGWVPENERLRGNDGCNGLRIKHEDGHSLCDADADAWGMRGGYGAFAFNICAGGAKSEAMISVVFSNLVYCGVIG